MAQKLNPQKFGLSSRTNLEKIGRNQYAIVVNRKSRLSWNDGLKIFEKIKKLREMTQDVKIDLITTAPICSKTVAFLKENGIDVIIQ